MKKFAVVLTVVLVLSMSFAVYAAPPAEGGAKHAAEDKTGGAGVPELLMKAYEKMTAGVTYSMEVKSKMNNQEFVTKTRAYFKDAKHYRMDSEVAGQKTRMVVDGDKAWTYMESANMIMTMPVPPDPKEQLKKDVVYAEGKDGDNVTYTFTDDATKMKIVTVINPKETLVVKTTTLDDKGETVSEMTYSDWKFDALDDSLFKKPEGAKEMQVPARPDSK